MLPANRLPLPLRASLLAAMVGLSPGCSSILPVDAIGSQGLSLNSAIETTHNGILLMNVIRSMHRMPQHWSALTVMRDSEEGTIKSGVGTIPFGGSSEGYEAGLEFDRTWNPSNEMQVQTSSEFTRAIMQPISLAQVDHFLEQGWPAEFVFRMCVGKINVKRPDGTTKQLRNRPTGSTFDEFNKYLDRAVAQGLTVEWLEDPSVPSDTETLELLRPLEVDLGRILEEGFRIEKNDAAKLTLSRKKKHDKYLALVLNGATALKEAVGSERRFVPLGKACACCTEEISFGMRSPEGLIYYLGQVTRHQLDISPTGEPLTYGWKSKPRSIFHVHRGKPAQAAVEIEFWGETYWIEQPDLASTAAPEDRSLMTLTFAQLLINLNRSKKDLPTTSIVTFGS